MYIEIKRIVCVVAVCCASLLVCADLALPVEDSFESGTLGDVWSGDGVISNLVYSYTAGVGHPITNANHTKVLWVEGSAVRAYAGDANSAKRTIDFLVMAEDLPDDELPDAEGDEQFRLAFDANGRINLYHGTASASRWTTLSGTQYPNGTWVRVTLKMEYPESAEGYAVCQVIVDGSPCSTEYGYRTAALDVAGGTWYKAAATGGKLASVDFSGVGGVDDLVLAATSEYSTPGSGTTTNGVDYGWLIDNGIAADKLDEKASNASAYTAKQSFEAGIDPYSTTPLYVTNATFSGESIKLTINGCKDDPNAAYSIITSTSPISSVNPGSSAGGTSFTSDSSGKTTEATIPIPTGNTVTYFQVATTSGNVTTTNQFGLLKITSTLTNTIVSAPWVSLGANVEDPTAMNVAKLVKTTNLTAGDSLILFDGSGYKSWVLNNDRTEWVSQNIVTSDGIIATEGAASATLARGQGIWLVRQNPTDSEGNAIPFYLYGQYTPAAASTSVAVGQTMLLANPNPNASFDIGSITPGEGDKVIVPGAGIPKIYTKENGSWGYEKTTTQAQGNLNVQYKTRVTNENTINAGQGFWYKSSKGTPTITWPQN